MSRPSTSPPPEDFQVRRDFAAAGIGGEAFCSSLLERAGELRTLEMMLLALQRGEGGVAVIEGPAGIGKTRLVGATLSRARARGLTVAEARGTELERDFAFGDVRQRFEPLLKQSTASEREELFAGAAGLAAPLVTRAGVKPPSRALQEGTHPVLHGLYWLVANYTGAAPLVVAVDDAHWADAPSLRFLNYLVNRLRGLPVLVLVARRTYEPDTDTELLDAIAAVPSASSLRPVPLGAGAVAKLVAASFAADPDLGFVEACLRVTKGNPLLLRELLFAVRADGARPTADCVSEVLAAGPDAVGKSVLRRLERLGPDALALAQSFAVLGERADLSAAAELAGLEPPQAADAAEALARALFALGSRLGSRTRSSAAPFTERFRPLSVGRNTPRPLAISLSTAPTMTKSPGTCS